MHPSTIPASFSVACRIGFAAFCLVQTFSAAGCSNSTGTVDGGAVDAQGPDGSVNDTGTSPDSGLPDGGTVDAAFLATELLGRPTEASVTVSVVPQQDLDVYFEYGMSPGIYSGQTVAAVYKGGEPFQAAIQGLQGDKQYFYRMRWRIPGEAAYEAGPERTFHTARAKGQPFVFTVQADPHLDENSNLDVYRTALANELADKPDFMIDLGDTFMCEKYSAPFTAVVQTAPDYPTVATRYLYERGNFGTVAHSVPLFLVNGNHEGESGWLNNGTADNIAVWATLARKAYYPGPQPDGFYSGGTADEPFVGKRGSWYAWTWGDALFIALDPYWSTKTKIGKDGWVLTLGKAQYDWLASTLSASDAKFRFVFIHNLVGGLDGQMRGGVEAAPYYEWGGKNPDDTSGFDSMRPGWGKPIHQLLVENHVTAVFHGHDHVYVKQELDGIVYQEMSQPSSPNFTGGPGLAAKMHYDSGTIQSSSGHLRISVAPDKVKVEYVRAYRPEDENASRHNGDVSDSYTLAPR